MECLQTEMLWFVRGCGCICVVRVCVCVCAQVLGLCMNVCVCGQLGGCVWTVDSWVWQMTSLSYHYREMRAKDECVFVHVIYWRWEGGFQLSHTHTDTHTHISASVWLGVPVHALAYTCILVLLLRSEGRKLTTMTDDVFIQLFQKTLCDVCVCVCAHMCMRKFQGHICLQAFWTWFY